MGEQMQKAVGTPALLGGVFFSLSLITRFCRWGWAELLETVLLLAFYCKSHLFYMKLASIYKKVKHSIMHVSS
jgi:hypothetical protein